MIIIEYVTVDRLIYRKRINKNLSQMLIMQQKNKKET